MANLLNVHVNVTDCKRSVVIGHHGHSNQTSIGALGLGELGSLTGIAVRVSPWSYDLRANANGICTWLDGNRLNGSGVDGRGEPCLNGGRDGDGRPPYIRRRSSSSESLHTQTSNSIGR